MDTYLIARRLRFAIADIEEETFGPTGAAYTRRDKDAQIEYVISKEIEKIMELVAR